MITHNSNLILCGPARSAFAAQPRSTARSPHNDDSTELAESQRVALERLSGLKAGLRRYKRRFVAPEFPTIDRRGISRNVIDAAGHRVLDRLRRGYATLVIDSAGAERTAHVCEALGYTRMR
jgi:hypothetical protein